MMKRFFIISVCLFIFTGMDSLYAQTGKETATHLFRVYEDNDLYNVVTKKSDRAYTNGTQINFFYTRTKPFHFFIDRMMPKAGDSAITIAGWGITQLIFTPENIADTYYQPNDYPYCGALFITRSVYSYHPVKRYSFQTEWFLGVRGPAAHSEWTQKFIHRFVGVRPPMGWSHQLNNKLIANLSFKAEKELFARNQQFEWIAGGEAFVGTTSNTIGLNSTIRFGKMTPYFKGFLSQFTGGFKGGFKKELQAYIFIKPAIVYNFHNGLLNGEIKVDDQVKADYRFSDRKLNYALDAGVAMTFRNWGISISQNSSGVFLQGLNDTYFGNFSFYYGW